MKKFIIPILVKLFEKLYGHTMSPKMKSFLGNLLLSLLGGGIAAVSFMALNILAGRLIGPDQYGYYNLALTISNLILIFIFCGLDTATVRYIASSESEEEKKSMVTSSSYFVFANLAVVSLLLLLFSFIFKSHSGNSNILVGVWILIAFVSLKTLFDGFIRSFSLFKLQFRARMLELASAVGAFIILFVLLKKYVYLSYVYTLSFGMLVLVFYYFINLKRYYSKFSKNSLFKLLSFGKLFLFNNILVTAFVSVDKFVIAKYLSVSSLGLYSAYYTASVIMVTQATQMIINVFFPSISAEKDKTFVLKIDRLFKLLGLPLAALLSLIIYAILLLFGSKYGTNMTLVAGFGIYATLQIVSIIYNAVVNTLSRNTYKKYLLWVNVVNATTILGYFILIYLHRISIPAIIGLLIANSILSIVVQRLMIYWSMKEKPEDLS